MKSLSFYLFVVDRANASYGASWSWIRRPSRSCSLAFKCTTLSARALLEWTTSVTRSGLQPICTPSTSSPRYEPETLSILLLIIAKKEECTRPTPPKRLCFKIRRMTFLGYKVVKRSVTTGHLTITWRTGVIKA